MPVAPSWLVSTITFMDRTCDQGLMSCPPRCSLLASVRHKLRSPAIGEPARPEAT